MTPPNKSLSREDLILVVASLRVAEQLPKLRRWFINNECEFQQWLNYEARVAVQEAEHAVDGVMKTWNRQKEIDAKEDK